MWRQSRLVRHYTSGSCVTWPYKFWSLLNTPCQLNCCQASQLLLLCAGQQHRVSNSRCSTCSENVESACSVSFVCRCGRAIVCSMSARCKGSTTQTFTFFSAFIPVLIHIPPNTARLKKYSGSDWMFGHNILNNCVLLKQFKLLIKDTEAYARRGGALEVHDARPTRPDQMPRLIHVFETEEHLVYCHFSCLQ